MRNYECPRCFFTTNNVSHMKQHINRRFRCENISKFSLNIDGEILFDYIKKNAKDTKLDHEKRVIKNEKFECKFCQKSFTARQNVYRHQKNCTTKINHIIVNNANSSNNNNKQEKGNCYNSAHNNNSNVGVNINEMIQQQNNNCVVINTYINLNPFQKEDLSHIDKILMLDMLFNNEDNDGVFSKNIFQKIHAELIRLPQNLNMYLEGFHSKSVIVYRNGVNLNGIEKESTKNAIFLRVKSIYEKVKDIYTDIYINYSHLFYEIYERYKHKKAFDFSASDDCFKKKMFESLVNAIDYRFEQYKTQSNSQCLVKYRQNIQTSIRMDLVDTRQDTKEIMGVN